MLKIEKKTATHWVVRTNRYIVSGKTLFEAIKEFILFAILKR